MANEHIIKGSINKNWIILFSSTIGMGGAFQHISIIGKEKNWKEHKGLTFRVTRGIGRSVRKNNADTDKVFYKVLDTIIIKDTLLILKENGLFSIDVSNEVTEKNLTQINNNEMKYNKLLKPDEENYILLNEEKYELAPFSQTEEAPLRHAKQICDAVPGKR